MSDARKAGIQSGTAQAIRQWAAERGEPAQPERPVRRGWPDLRCPLCTEPDQVTVSLHDTASLTCQACGDTFTVQTVEQWQGVIAWIRQAPARG